MLLLRVDFEWQKNIISQVALTQLNFISLWKFLNIAAQSTAWYSTNKLPNPPFDVLLRAWEKMLKHGIYCFAWSCKTTGVSCKRCVCDIWLANRPIENQKASPRTNSDSSHKLWQYVFISQLKGAVQGRSSSPINRWHCTLISWSGALKGEIHLISYC